MFFEKLSSMLDACDSVVVTMKKKDGKIILAVVPKIDKDAKQLAPLIISGTAKEIDEGFAGIWAEAEKVTGLLSNVKVFAEGIKAKEESKKAEAAGTTKKPTTGTGKGGNKGDKGGKAQTPGKEPDLFGGDTSTTNEEEPEEEITEVEPEAEPEKEEPQPANETPSSNPADADSDIF